MLKKVKELFMPVLLASVFVGGLVIMFTGGNGSNSTAGNDTAFQIKVPELTALGEQGKVLFDANCAACHGVNAGGTDKGPPFVHDIYNPGHHGDEAFIRAAAGGVRSHHWSFGDMPPVATVNRDEVLKIVEYVREMQQANGIQTRQHNM